MEEMAVHLQSCFWNFKLGSAKACVPGLFSRMMVPSGTRVFMVGDPYLFLKEG